MGLSNPVFEFIAILICYLKLEKFPPLLTPPPHLYRSAFELDYKTVDYCQNNFVIPIQSAWISDWK